MSRVRARLAAAVVLLAGWSTAQQPTLSDLAAEGRWDELDAMAAERLQAEPGDEEALYWSARALLARAEALRAGPEFARELAASWARRAQDGLGAVRDAARFPDAADWALYARYLQSGDEALAGDLERLAAEGSGYAASLRGRLASDMGAPAADWFERAAALRPGEAGVLLDLAWARAAEGDTEGALAALESARAAGAGRERWLAILLIALPGPGNAARLLARLEPLLQEPDGAQDALLAGYRAWALEQLGRTEEALAVLSAASLGRTPPIERAQARLLLLLGRPDEAATRLVPLAQAGDAEALDLLVSAADALATGYRWDEALAAYDSALATEPAHLRAAANRALALASSGRSLDGYAGLLAARPGRLDLVNDAALAHVGWGRTDEARALLERAAAGPDGAPGVADARENLAALLLALRPPDAEAALGLLERVLAADPGRDRSLTLRAAARRIAR